MSDACTYSSVKIILSFFTTLLLLFGAALLGISIFIYAETDNVYLSEEELSGFDTSIVVYIAMAAGAAMILFSLIGLLGSFGRNKCLIYFYIVLLSLTFGLEIAGGVVGFLWRNDISEDLPTEMQTKLNMYKDDLDVQKAWNEVHEKYECCGRMGTSDFLRLHGTVPTSCKTYKAGCYYDVEKNIKRNLEMASASLLCLALFQLLVICFASLFIMKINKEKMRYKI